MRTGDDLRAAPPQAMQLDRWGIARKLRTGCATQATSGERLSRMTTSSR